MLVNKKIFYYKDFPFQQLILLEDQVFFANSKILMDKPTCTFSWLIKFYPVYIRFDNLLNFYLSEVTNWPKKVENISQICDFEKILINCNRTTISSTSEFQLFSLNSVELKMRLNYAQTVLIFISPFVSIVGLVTNLMVIFIVGLNKNAVEMKDKRHYVFMQLNSGSNCILFVIQLVGLINKCNEYFWCSTVYYLEVVQYFKIVFNELIGTFFRFMSNFTYVAFSLSRLSLIGQEHGKLVTKISKETRLVYVMAIMIVASLILSVSKIFQYVINDSITSFIDFSSHLSQKYPIKYSMYNYLYFRNDHSALTILVSVFNFISDLVNYSLFFAVNLGIDFYTAVLFRKTLEKKMKNISNEAVRQKKEKENAEAIRRTNAMVIFNTSNNLLLKFPLVFNTILELVTNVSFDYVAYFFNNSVKSKNALVYFCFELNGCEMYDELSNVLFFLSLTLTLLFHYKFDNNFKYYFRKYFFSKTKAESPVTNQQ